MISKPVNASFARYQCLVNANYPFSYLWSVNGVSLDDTTSSFILLERSTKERELVCTIQNDENNLVEKSASIKIPPQGKNIIIPCFRNATLHYVPIIQSHKGFSGHFFLNHCSPTLLRCKIDMLLFG